MKKFLLWTLAVLFCMLLSACWSTLSERAEVYHNELVQYAQPAYLAYNQYSAFSQETPLEEIDVIKKSRNETITSIQTALEQLQQLGDFEWEWRLLDAVKHDVEILLWLMEWKETELIAVWEKMKKAEQDKNIDEMDALLTQQATLFLQINTAIEESDEILQEEQKLFLEKYDLPLQQAALSWEQNS